MTSKRLVFKYGGSSQRDATVVSQTLAIGKKYLSECERLVEVVSAPGKRGDQGVKMTDRIRVGAMAVSGGGAFDGEIYRDCLEHFQEIYTDLGLSADDVEKVYSAELQKRLTRCQQELNGSRENEQQAYAAIISAPEFINAQLRVAVYQKQNIPAYFLDPQQQIVVGGALNAAYYLPELSIQKIKMALQDGIGVRPGFQGATEKGQYAIFPRGGSDITGAIDAEAMDADCYYNCSDVNGVKQIDPRVFADDLETQNTIKTIPQLTYDEIEELAITGAAIVHPLAIAPTRRANIPIRICNTADIDGECSVVSNDKQRQVTGIKGIACVTGLGYIMLHSPDMIGRPGYVKKFSDAFQELGVDIEMVFTSPTVIVANTKDVSRLGDVERQLKPFGEVLCGKGTGMVSIVGEGYQGDPTIAIRYLHSLRECGAEARINRQTQALKCSYWISIDEQFVSSFAKNIFHNFFGAKAKDTLSIQC